MVCTRTVATEE